MICPRPLLLRVIFELMGGGDGSGRSGGSGGGRSRVSRALSYIPMAPLMRMKSAFAPPLNVAWYLLRERQQQTMFLTMLLWSIYFWVGLVFAFFWEG